VGVGVGVGVGDLRPPSRIVHVHVVLDFVESVLGRAPGNVPLRSSAGLWADLGFDITDEDIAEARREMWANFPREDS
jgi:hypothetical protein